MGVYSYHPVCLSVQICFQPLTVFFLFNMGISYLAHGSITFRQCVAYIHDPDKNSDLVVKFLCPLWEKAAYCLHLSFSRSVDQEMSGHYLLTPLLENHQTRYNGCLLRVGVPYWCSAHMVKSQGQTVGLNPKCCILNIMQVKLWFKVKLSTANHRMIWTYLLYIYTIYKRFEHKFLQLTWFSPFSQP